MDKTKHSGIKIERIHLMECSVGNVSTDAELRFNLGLKSMSREQSQDGLRLTMLVTFDLMAEVENPPCDLICTFLAEYSRTEDSNMTWEEFTDVMAIMHMIPYVREFVSSVSLRLPLKELIIPPTNVNALLSAFKAR